MTREEMLEVFEKMYDNIHDPGLIEPMDRLRESIRDLTVRVELSVHEGIMGIDRIQATTDLQFILDFTNHDTGSYYAGTDGSFVPHRNQMPLSVLRNNSVSFDDQLRKFNYKKKGLSSDDLT